MKANIIYVILVIVGVIIAVRGTAHADNVSYDACVNRCYLDIPGKAEYIEDEKRYWEINSTTDSHLNREYKSMVKHAKIDCRINCVVGEIKFQDHAVKYYDTDVKNFPLTNE